MRTICIFKMFENRKNAFRRARAHEMCSVGANDQLVECICAHNVCRHGYLIHRSNWLSLSPSLAARPALSLAMRWKFRIYFFMICFYFRAIRMTHGRNSRMGATANTIHIKCRHFLIFSCSCFAWRGYLTCDKNRFSRVAFFGGRLETWYIWFRFISLRIYLKLNLNCSNSSVPMESANVRTIRCIHE